MAKLQRAGARALDDVRPVARGLAVPLEHACERRLRRGARLAEEFLQVLYNRPTWRPVALCSACASRSSRRRLLQSNGLSLAAEKKIADMPSTTETSADDDDEDVRSAAMDAIAEDPAMVARHQATYLRATLRVTKNSQFTSSTVL